MQSYQQVLIACAILSISIVQCNYLGPMTKDARTGEANSDLQDPHAIINGDPNQDGSSEDNFLQPHSLGFIPLNDTSLVVKWELGDAALDNMQFFKIQYRSSKKPPTDWVTENRDIPPNTKAFQLNGLKPGNYFFVVTAVYDNDDNSPSKQVKYTLRARSKVKLDDMPTKLAPKIHWTESGADWIMLKWKYNFKDKDLEDTGYLVYYRSSHQIAEFSIYQTDAENMELIQLEHETPYEVKVVAYNRYGVSDFSETVTIKTLKQNETTTIPPTLVSSIEPGRDEATLESSKTTAKPASEDVTTTQLISSVKPTEYPTHKYDQYTSTTTTSTSPRPILVVGPTNKANHRDTERFSLDTIVNYIQTIHRDNALLIAYASLMVVIICSAIIVLICLVRHIKCGKKSPPSSTNESVQFDIEINGYFKNSFPGVEKDYPTIGAHHGFVNNHPHINDCT